MATTKAMKFKGERAECPFCQWTDEHESKCQASYGFWCTLPAGHSGPHVACAGSLHALQVWNDDEEEGDMADNTDTNALDLPKQAGLSAHIDENGPALVLEQWHYDNRDPVEIRLSMAEARRLYAWLPGVLPAET